MSKANIFSRVPAASEQEIFEELLTSEGVRIERILSYGQSSPEEGWYDQEENEWVLVLQGEGCIAYEDGREVILKAGNYLELPRHTRHRVAWTAAGETTIWLAIFYP
ncbi:cupin domain-containing protein [Marinospirillum perlucidum]|uniref:cupin domain-containing protein n=1 Tax=Marinospirillum perlucidum TaxID=1982602 RepID=UPI000DF40486|nr:cupin domain-containing protein [Marinospirillum perlucidum]